MLFFMSATPKRAMAISFAGPLYDAPYVMVNNKSFHGKTWADYNKPEVKVVVQMGAAVAQLRKIYMPNATTIELPNESEINLAVTARRADAMFTYVVNALLATAKNPNLGVVVNPVPHATLPVYAGHRVEPDRRFTNFLHWWAEWNRLSGRTADWVKKGFMELGVKSENVESAIKF